MLYLVNAFSLQMLTHPVSTIFTSPMTAERARNAMISQHGVSAIGHLDTARVVGKDLCLPLMCSQQRIRLNQGDTLIVAQITGGRLPIDAEELPAYMELTYSHLEVRYT